MRRRRRRRGTLDLERSGPWIAVVGLFMVAWCTFSTILFAPWWGVAIAFALMAPQIWLVRRWAVTHPTWSLWVPVTGLVVWTGYAVLGARIWGWSP